MGLSKKPTELECAILNLRVQERIARALEGLYDLKRAKVCYPAFTLRSACDKLTPAGWTGASGKGGHWSWAPLSIDRGVPCVCTACRARPGDERPASR